MDSNLQEMHFIEDQRNQAEELISIGNYLKIHNPHVNPVSAIRSEKQIQKHIEKLKLHIKNCETVIKNSEVSNTLKNELRILKNRLDQLEEQYTWWQKTKFWFNQTINFMKRMINYVISLLGYVARLQIVIQPFLIERQRVMNDLNEKKNQIFDNQTLKNQLLDNIIHFQKYELSDTRNFLMSSLERNQGIYRTFL